MSLVSENNLFHESDDIIDTCELSRRNAENTQLLAEGLHQESINKQEWNVDR